MIEVARSSTLRLVLYLALVLLPLPLGLIQLDPGRGFWINLSVALGFVGLSMFGLQFVLAARTRFVPSQIGLEQVLQMHRSLAYVATVLVFAHPIILFVRDTRFLGLLDVIHAPMRAQLAVTSVVALLVLIALSVWRRRLGIGYEAWQVWHAVLALVVVVAALLHVLLVGYYVREPWEQATWVVLSGAFIALGVWVRIVKPLLRRRRRWQVEHVSRGAGSTTITLRLVDPTSYGADGFHFRAGQFAWLTARRSPFSLTYHPFSFSSSAERHDRVSFTIKAFERFTREVATLTEGEFVYLDGPHGSFNLDGGTGGDDLHRPGPLVLVGAGVGVTPLLSMLATLADRGSDRECHLWLANREESSIVCAEELAELEARLNLTVVHILSEPAPDWVGERGRLDAGFVRRHLPPKPDRATYFMCGPVGLMDTVQAECAAAGVPRDRVHAERFGMV